MGSRPEAGDTLTPEALAERGRAELAKAGWAGEVMALRPDAATSEFSSTEARGWWCGNVRFFI